ncbi:MAG: type II toxin-antitoxin system VapC family toxin [Actinomycetota bacterium]|nr:type II toxin-antitoxin system VapC family toxin [Nocardioidaceae bacterium]MDQ3479853.1 type II toxin-antitoxin system VapC family toxin [Actinomycetota bacterium]
MLYLDTSLLVAALTPETNTADVQRWLSEQVAGQLAVSDWVTTEFSSALSLKTRVGALAVEERDQALDAYRLLTLRSFEIVPVTRNDFLVAARFLDRSEMALRAGDALHVAVALRTGAVLVTLDRELRDQGIQVGVDCRIPTDNA